MRLLYLSIRGGSEEEEPRCFVTGSRIEGLGSEGISRMWRLDGRGFTEIDDDRAQETF